MLNRRSKIILWVCTFLAILGIYGSVQAAPYYRQEATILPIADSLYDLGTSTKAWRDFYIDQICLTGDVCRTTWPTGGGGSNPFLTVAGGQATTSLVYFYGGLYSLGSSTIQFASTTALSASVICIETDCRTSWPAGGSGGGIGWASSTNPESIYFVGDGNVGIGTTLPTANLVVSKTYVEPAGGIASTTGMVVSNNNIANGTSSISILSRSSASSILNFGSQLAETTGQIIYGHVGNPQYTNTMAFVTDSSERMRIDSLGNVGIGTKNPLTSLHINENDVSNYGAILIGDSTNSSTAISMNQRAYFGYGGDMAVIQGMTSKGIQFNVNNATFGSGEAMRITSAGNVGIGTTSPYAKLSVKGAGTGTGVGFQVTTSGNVPNFTVLDNGTTTIRADAPIGWSYTDDNPVLTHTIRGGGINPISVRVAAFSANTPIFNVIGNAGVERLTVLNAGNVGIGTTSPAAKLSVEQDATTVWNAWVGDQGTAAASTTPFFTIDGKGRALFGTSTTVASAQVSIANAGNNTNILQLADNNHVTRHAFTSTGYTGPNTGTLSMPGNSTISGGTLTATAAVNSGAGTAAAPSFRGGSDTDTGMWLPGANQLGWSTGGQDRLRLNTNGMLGIGSTTPGAWLSINTATTTMAMGIPFILVASSSPASLATTTYLNLDNQGRLYLPQLTQSGVAQTYYACGVATTFELVWDTTTCLVSAEKFKKDIEGLNPSDALRAVLSMQPVTYMKRDPLGPNDANRQPGFIADWVTDPVLKQQLVSLDKNGDVHGFRYEQYSAYLTGAIQALAERTSDARRTAEENWQWFAICLLAIGLIYQQVQLRKLKKQL